MIKKFGVWCLGLATEHDLYIIPWGIKLRCVTFISSDCYPETYWLQLKDKFHLISRVVFSFSTKWQLSLQILAQPCPANYIEPENSRRLGNHNNQSTAIHIIMSIGITGSYSKWEQGTSTNTNKHNSKTSSLMILFHKWGVS